jgi:hypothetical protein
MPLGTGLAGDAPICKPFAPTGALGSVPSDEVTPSEGMTVPTWADAGLQHNKGQAAAAMNNGLMRLLRLERQNEVARGRKHRSRWGSGSNGFCFHDRSQSKNCLSISAEIDVPTTPAFPSPAPPARPRPTPTVPTPLPVVPHAAVLVVGGEIVGTGGAAEFAAPTTGNTLGNGTAGAEPTPRLLISVEPNGIPVRAPPPGVVGDVNAELGVDDEAMLLEPEPHVPDIPDVSSVPEAVDVPSVTGISAVTDDGVVPDVTILPVIVAAVAGVAAPGDIPPPSKLAVDPYMPAGDIPALEHVVPPVVITPVVGIAIVPVTPVGSGLSPGDVSSVEPSGVPAGPTDALAPNPNGEVASTEGVAVIGSSNWANAGLHSKDQATAKIKEVLMENFPDMSRIADYAASRSGGAMNSGPTGSLTVSCRILSMSAIAELSMCQPMTSAIGES